MSTSVLYPNAAWKQEVHRSLAAHRSRRSMLAGQPSETALKWAVSSGRGSQVAARVAARYAHAPSFSELQAVEAPVAPRAVSPVPQAAPQPVIAQPAPEASSPSVPVLQPAIPVTAPWEPEMPPPVAVAPPSAPAQASAPILPPESLDAWENSYTQSAWQPDPRLRPVLSDVVRSPRPAQMDEFFSAPGPVAVEPDQPIHANLIEFPRVVVAPRKMRPRRAEGIAADGMDRQLSIFEVDPGAFPAPSQAEA